MKKNINIMGDWTILNLSWSACMVYSLRLRSRGKSKHFDCWTCRTQSNYHKMKYLLDAFVFAPILHKIMYNLYRYVIYVIKK